MEKRFMNPTGVAASPAYTHAVEVSGGKTIFISGQVALDEKGELVGRGDLREQTRKVFENLKRALAAAGARFEDVVKTTYYVVQPDMKESNLTPCYEADREKVTKLVKMDYTDANVNLALAALDEKQELWMWFLVGVIALLCGEVWMTRRIALNR